ncbi:MAG: Crp/Fnr family transcriptional regulator [Chitinophagaceae bacterium]
MSVQQLHTFIQAVYPLQEKEWNAFSSIWSPFECKRKTILTAIGETEKHLYFVLEGLQRAFYIGEDNQEGTIVFTYPPSFSGVADSFLTQTPSKYFFETLTTSRFLRTTYKQMEELMLEYPEIQAMVLRITAFALKGVLERQVELQCFSAEEKFRTLLKRSPHVLQIIPHKYLASYLGIDPATFSKLLSSKRI